MAVFGLSDRQRKNYFSLVPTNVPESFIDYIHLFVYSIDTNELIGQTKFPFTDILNSDNYETDSGVVRLNIGQHIRDLGFIDGDFRVEYKFLKTIAESSEGNIWYDIDGNVYENLRPGIDIDQAIDPNDPDPQGGFKYYLLRDGEIDFSTQLYKTNKNYDIDAISPDRTEVIIEPNGNSPSSIQFQLNRQLDLIDKPTVVIPSKIEDPGLKNKEIKFLVNEINKSEERYTLEIPESDSNVFDLTDEGRKIVFENFFSAWIPTHTKGKFFEKGNDDKKRVKYSFALGNPPNPNVFISPSEYSVDQASLGAGLDVRLPYFSNDKSITITDFNSTNNDYVTTLPQGHFIRRISKETTPQNVSYLPKDIWQTNNLGPRSDGTFHYDFAGYYPYEYNKSNDTDNIDWAGDLVADKGNAKLKASGINKDFEGGYAKGNWKQRVYLDWNTTITKVINSKTIEVKGNLKEYYYRLREEGFRIEKIGDVEYTPMMIKNIPFDRLSTNKFYYVSEANDIEQFKTFLKINNDFYLITNFKNSGDGRAFKLFKPLQNNITTTDDDNANPQKISVVSEVLNPYLDRVTLFPPESVNDTFLYPANFDGVENQISLQQTDYKTYNQLTSSKSSQTEDIERLLVSGSLLDVQPNIDYQKTTTDLLYEVDDTGFGNFVHFSSAERRLRNFKKKLELIQDYTAESSSLVSVSSSLSKVQSIEKKRQRVYNSFNPYEDFLYYESSSFSSGSNGIFHDTSWPKMTSSTPYKLEHTSGSVATTWFDNMILSSSNYDYNNQNSLRNSLPEHINQDVSNNVFLEFMDMVGEQFDETWTYIKSLTDINFRVNNISEGISKDVTKYYAEALGVKLYNGNALTDLSEYLLGKNTDGTDKNETPGEALTEETWKRILANLPFFIKTKGTERALKGIMNCYGIPSSVLRVREFGGPDKGTRVSYELKRKFTYALDFKAGQYIRIPFINDSNNKAPQTTEFRFRTPHKANQTIYSKAQGHAIQLINSGSTNYGYVRLAVSSSTGITHLDTPKLKLFNNDFWSVMLTRVSSSGELLPANNTNTYASQSIDYEITAKQYDSTRQRIIYEQSSSLTVDGNSALSASYNQRYINNTQNSYIGGNGSDWGSQFSGSIMEFRFWSEPLSQSVFDNHVRVPKSYNGNSTSSAYDNLLFRLPLDDNRNLQTNPTASNISYIKTYQGTISGSNVNGFTGNFYRSLTDQEKVKMPNVGIRRNATKIRLEDNNLPVGVSLSPELKQEESSQDFAPVDSNKLGVYFSPTDVINEDIIYTFADFNLDNEIGDPRDEFEDSYRGLRRTRFDYFKRYVGGHNHFFDYLRILDFYDDSVFSVLKQFVPARAQGDFGNLIESNILERNKQFRRKPEFTQPYYENANDFQEGVLVTRFISGSDNNTIQTFGEFPYHESVICYATGSGRTLTSATQVHINELKPQSTEPATYATASVVRGGTNIEFKETLQPFISSSRLSMFNKDREFYYTSSLSVSTANGFGENWKYPGGFYVYSSSLEPSEYEKITTDTLSEKLTYLGTQLDKFSNPDGDDPVQVEIVSATTLTTTTPGESFLDVD
jgi:hypothetical protein